MLLGTQKINSKNHLEIGGCDTVELAREFGTPLYVMDEEFMRERMRDYRQSLEDAFNGESAIAYASKAFICQAMCAIVREEGLYMDVASAGELYTAKTAGFPMDKILFHGNFKSVEELEMCVELGVGYVVIDSFEEIDKLDSICQSTGRRANVMVRCNPGVDPHTHRLISTGQEDSKFGFNIKDGSAYSAVEMANAKQNLDVDAVHCHVGSQLLDMSPFKEAAPVMVDFIKELKDKLGIEVRLLDMGGGLGVRYLEEYDPPSVPEFTKMVADVVTGEIDRAGIAKPVLMLEPGRSIAGEAGTTLYTVGPIKEVAIAEEPGKRNYLAVDGGLSDNPRPALYDAVYTSVVANKMDKSADNMYTVVGRHCETDWLIPQAKLAQAETGDVLAVQVTGAYNHAMASNYNRFTRPAVVTVRNGKAEIIVKREELADLVRNDVLPERISGGELSSI